MEVEESISVAPSPENGNVSVETEPTVPSEPTEPVAPAEPEPVVPTEPVVELFELPDGRKVDAVTLTKEWKENFLPEFTQKSQKLAELTKQPLAEQPKSPYADPSYVPQSYEEILNAAEERVLKSIEQREADKIAQNQAIENAVIGQLEEVKKIDPTVNENQLFLHATKYGFRDLTIAHQNMKDMADLAKKVQQTTVQNVQKRNDPVSVSPGASGVQLNPDHFASSVEYLRALKGQ